MVYDYRQIEPKVNEFWSKNRVPQEITEFPKSPKKKFYLLDGPPYANARAHVGHSLTIMLKDVWGKFKTMQGYDVWWQPGFDCHGLPIENKVEKEIGIESKPDILKYGSDKFIEKCRSFATTNLNEWMVLYKRMAAWKGWVDPYFTYDDSYIESGWWTVKRLHEKGQLYRGTKPIHWCPHCGTALSGYEVTDSYAQVQDPSVYLKFKIVGSDEHVLVWTTTPWTLPSNVALLVHPDETYVKIKTGNETLILAKALVDTVMKRAGVGYRIVEEFPGKKLDGLRYEPLIDCEIQRDLVKNKNAHRIYVSVPLMLGHVASKVAEKKGIESSVNYGHIVTMDTGTGIVHIAPGHGSEDSKIGEHYKLPAPSPLNDACEYTEGTGFTGFVKDADPKIVEYLKENGKLFFKEKVTHAYPLCWRCKSPLIFRLSTQWFLSIDTIKQKMLKANDQVRWLPEFAKDRMRNHLAESPDWCISTQRFWGIPLPIWICGSCERYEVIGSKDELEKRLVSKTKLDDLHKNVVDKAEIFCESCEAKMTRVPDVLNVWFDSGIGPWASLGYPHKNKALFENLWSVDLGNESQDQIRGWFYYLLFLGVSTFDKKPFETACLNGWVVDEKGDKMSKSVGNVVNADEAVERLGADVLRLYQCGAGAAWGVNRFSYAEAEKLHAQMNVLLNLRNFVDMYGLKLAEGKPKGDANRWIVSRTNQLVREVTADLEEFRFYLAARKLNAFLLNDFSRTYMKLAKDDDPAEVGKAFAYAMNVYLRLLAPICPYISEYVYQELFGKWKGSLHAQKWPVAGAEDEKLERSFAVLEAVSEAVMNLRQDAKIGLRYPIKGLVVSGSKDLTDSVLNIEKIVKDVVNVKEVVIGKTGASYEVKPNYAALGPKYGKDVKKIEDALKSGDSAKIVAAVSRGDSVKVAGFELLPEDLSVRVTTAEGKGFMTTLGPGVVVLDTRETPEIREESFVRELARAVQQRRKELGLKMGDRVTLHLNAKDATLKVLKKWEAYVKSETGSSKIVFNEPLREARICAYKDWTVEFEAVK